MARINIVREDPLWQGRVSEVIAHNVPDCLASIQEKKVRGVALNCLEILVDWIASTFYDAYNTLYDLKRVMYRHGCDMRATDQYSIHHFPDGTRLYDLTDRQRARVWRINDHGELRDVIVLGREENHEFRHHRVLFSRQAPEHVIDFSAQRGTRCVVVHNQEGADPAHVDICTIYEYEEDLPAQAVRRWCLNIIPAPVEVAHPLSYQVGVEERVYFAEASARNG